MQLNDERLYYIGGIVRDMVLDRPCFDVDITFVGNAIEYVKSLPDIEIIRVNEPFGTVKIRLDGKEIDIASTRNETYPHAGHLPVVEEIGCSLKKDVERRDFTINTLAKSLSNGEIIDYLGGLEDIKNKKIRVLHDRSFIDDPTRIIRGLKFSVRFGFELDSHTKFLQDEYLNNINYDMSYKRVKKELMETFNLNSQLSYEKFFCEGIYKLISEQEIGFPNYDIQSLVERYPVQDIWMVYLGWMDLSKLPLTKREMKIIEDYHRLKSLVLEDDFSIYSEFKTSEKESILLYAINVDDKKVFRYFDELSKVELTISGKDLQDLGIQPSIEYSKCFEYVLKEKLNNSDIDEIAAAKEYFSNL